ncbi:MAG: bifunctional homocysteine S-methyltransferase/methylenetetrahydrofolate reductase [Deltaproteobacteria bacterium]|jgi:methionine synthase I (cobalamin-dependent)/5,10-methylenetetrahydrofolate reductase
MPARHFLDALRDAPLVFDGAMGTILYERGVLYTQSFDALCLSREDLVRGVHQDYLKAGAQVLQTNTFGANRIRLAAHNLERDVIAINRAGVRIAREVADTKGAFVAGCMGPTGLLLKSVARDDFGRLTDAFREQAEALLVVAEGQPRVDLITLETFRQTEEIHLALDAVRGVLATLPEAQRVPVVASVSFDTFGTMADGLAPAEVAKRLVEWGADAIGVNCADGPAGVYETSTQMLEAGLPVIAQPNAGLPHRVDGRFAYMATPDYFLVYARRMLKAGVRAVGGCCGTTPEHIRQMAASARMLAATMDDGTGEAEPHESSGAAPIAEGVRVVPLAEKGRIGEKLAKRDMLVSVEVNPPAGLSLTKALEAAKMLRDGGVDVINVADGARATARMGNFVLCHRIQQELGMPALMHLTTRDRNVLGLVAHLLGCHELGVQNLVVITGDPPKMGDFPDATAVYDLDSIGLLRLVNGLNRGFDPGGKPLGGATRFLCATGAEPAAHDYDREIKRLRLKIEAGAELVMTQPVYDPAVLDRFLSDVEELDIPVLVGILPLASHKNAEFLHNEVPGMSVPLSIRERMRKAGPGEAGRREGVAIAREMLEAVKGRVHGAYIMPPLGRYELALRVIEGIVR